MKRFKKAISLIGIVLLLAAQAAAFSGCTRGAAHNDPERFMVYFTNQYADDIIFKEHEIKGAPQMEQVDLLQRLLDYMFTQNEEDTKFYVVKPETVLLQGMIVKDGIVTLDFNNAYLNMTNVREIIFRASVVLTLIQVSGVTGVAFTVDEAPITTSSGDSVGIMTKDTFVNVLLTEEGMLKQETDLTIYFADEAGEKLVPVDYRFTIDNSNTSMEEYIMNRILEGPVNTQTKRTVAKDLTVSSIVTTDHICYVNFSKNFLNQEQPVSDEIMVYSIVNSLCRLTYVHSVQFMVEGDTNVLLHGTMDLSSPMIRDSSYIQQY